MEPKYFIEEVHINSENRKKDGLLLAIKEGDIILDKIFRFEVLPAEMDFVKPVSRKKLTNEPEKISERLLRIKELGESTAVVAVLHQESYIEDSNTMLLKEIESLKTVNYGEQFFVYAKQQFYDMRGGIMYSFVIKDMSKTQS